MGTLPDFDRPEDDDAERGREVEEWKADNNCLKEGYIKLEAERDSLRTHAGNLLAVIHRDGGHYTSDLGFEAACVDGEKVVCDLRTQVDSLQYERQQTAATEDLAHRRGQKIQDLLEVAVGLRQQVAELRKDNIQYAEDNVAYIEQNTKWAEENEDLRQQVTELSSWVGVLARGAEHAAGCCSRNEVVIEAALAEFRKWKKEKL